MTTPPAGVPPMPKIDMVRSTPEGCWHCYKVTAESPTTSIERAYATLSSMFQQERAENERLREALDHVEIELQQVPEINPSNYNHDDVCALNDAMIEVYLGLKKFNETLTPKETTDE